MIQYTEKMLKKLFQILAFFAIFSVICCAVLLFYSKRNYTNFAVIQQSVQNGKVSLHWKSKGNAQEPKDSQGMGLKPESSNNMTEMSVSSAQKPAPGNEILGECPQTPPNLVGPLLVEFSSKRILEKVREEVGPPLQEGGRYKPSDCVSQHKVAIIIAFRNRHEHLIHWLYYLHPILIRQQLDYGVYVLNQDGDGVFNRAKLMNVGYAEALKEYDYDCFVFSDIDLVPMDDRNLYRCFDNPRHLAVAMDKFNFDLPYNTYFGGVASLSKQQFLKINGFPNTYWGWGGEDDDIYRRIIFKGMSISRPDMEIGKYKMIKHIRDLHNEPNPVNPGKLEKTQWTMSTDGINSLSYTVKTIMKDRLYTFITVDIQAPPG